MKYLYLASKVINYKLSRIGLFKTPKPIVLTFSVTNKCQSRCKTCYVWELYKKNPKLKEKELKLDEIEKIFKNIGHIYFFNISGGEPYLRQDLPEIVDLACRYLTPQIIHTPTNALAPNIIEKKTIEILDIMEKNKSNIPFTIKPSFDGIGKKHDEIRGVKGNFDKVLDTIKRLKKLQKNYKNLQIGLGTVISKFNINNIAEISDYAHSLNLDSYIHEIAEPRSELFNLKDNSITPNIDDYKKAVEYFSKEVKKTLKNKVKLTKSTQAFRLFYYNLAIKILKEKKQVIPCYAGLTNAHISPYGDVWPCCILGYDQSMGNLRDYNYDFKKIWHSEKAKEIRKFIKDKKCYCPLANMAYSNILCNTNSMSKVIWNILKGTI